MEDYLHILKSNNLHVESPQQQQEQLQKIEIKSQQEDIEFKIDYEREDNFLESAIVPEFNNKMKKPLDARKSDIQNYYSSKGTSLNQSISQKKQDNTQNQTQQEVRFFSVEENAFNLESPALAMQNLNKKSSNINNMFLDSPIQQSVQKIQDCSSKQLSPKSASKRSIIQPNFKKTTTKQSALIKEATQAQKQRRQSDEYEFAVKKLQIIQDSNISSKVQNMAQKIVCFCRNQATPQIKGLVKQKQDLIEQQVKKDLNIINFIKDIMFLKKAMMLILTKDQYSAIQLIGLSSKFTDSNLINFEMSNSKLENDYSPYESQFIIAQSKELQERYLQNFLLRCSDEQEEMSSLDQRIFQSLKRICSL
ncbi:hypothetical protein ABPG73_004674 [Tetrahymena malaccensis]